MHSISISDIQSNYFIFSYSILLNPIISYSVFKQFNIKSNMTFKLASDSVSDLVRLLIYVVAYIYIYILEFKA